MAIAFAYTKSTNTVVVTGGTSGTPATFANFVTADRAGSVTLLAATAGLSPTLPLTYQITPVEKLALLISFVVANKTAEADYIFITGTDAWDAAQTESIDVSAGNGTYVSTKRFRTITNIDCSDNAAGGGTVWADGTVAVIQPQWGVIWNYGNGQYKIDCNLIFGNGSTSTVFTSKNDNVYWGANYCLTTQNNILNIGELSNGGSINGSVWTWVGRTTSQWFQHGIVNIYGSVMSWTASANWIGISFYLDLTAVNLKTVIFKGDATNACVLFKNANLIADDIRIEGLYFFIDQSPSSLSNINVTNGSSGLVTLSTVSASNMTIGVNNGIHNVYTQGAGITLSCVDSTYSPDIIPSNYNDGSTIKEQYTVNIHVADKNGVNLGTAAVLCQDQFGSTVFNVNTAADGTIAKQTISYRQWADSAETLTTYSPHKFTISKPGYQTLVLDAITVSAPIKWHLELQRTHLKTVRNRRDLIINL